MWQEVAMLKYKLQTKYLKSNELDKLEKMVNDELTELYELGIEIVNLGHPKREVGAWYAQVVYKIYDEEENKFNK